VCPSGLVCDDAHHACTTRGQLEACTGRNELASCEAAGVIAGVCHEGVCLSGGCGNARIDPGEACDDGNRDPLDGCSADCTSDETCGNGVVDVLLGEQCDDSNHVGRDGCDSACTAESLEWSQTISDPAFVRQAGVAYDDARARAIVFGGCPGTALCDVTAGAALGRTIEWDGKGWLDVTPPVSPKPRARVAMAYDSARHVVVMFGGVDGARVFGDTWEWDGARWTEVTPDQSPLPRDGAVMTYDPGRHRMVMFGGRVDTLYVPETWEYDGARWVLIASTGPNAFDGHSITYDPIHGQVMLYDGGLWSYDGATWIGVASGASLASVSLSFDRRRGQLVMIGGGSASAWDGTTWQPLAALAAAEPASVFDPSLQTTVVFAGYVVSRLDASIWTALPFAPPPYTRVGATATFDRGRGRFVMFGGTFLNRDLAELWEFDGGHWTLAPVIPPPTGPPETHDAEVAYDAACRCTVIVGGLTSGNPMTSTWQWDGSTWFEYPTTNTTAYGAVAYDTTRQQVVRFGGADAVGSTNVTSTWSAGAWSVVTTASAPSRRTGHAMAYDERRHRVVLFGGGDDGVVYDDTWEWDGAAWAQLHPSSSPSARLGHRMVYDARRGAIVMFGGAVLVGLGQLSPRSDSWTFDGVTWRRMITASEPKATVAAAMAYDSTRGEVILLTDHSGSSIDDDVWRLRWGGGHYDTCDGITDLDGDHLVGCADPDCLGYCDPSCSQVMTSCLPSEPRCGDLSCSVVESCSLCPMDCPACEIVCGDHQCNAGEMITNCPGDCTP
jgi:cysteine-rich repeat protein